MTSPRVQRAAGHLMEALARLTPERPLRVEVSGLNPHAGEGGLFGNEEREVVSPAVGALRAHPLVVAGEVRLGGPTAAEAVFRGARDGRIHGVVAMYHDQATIASKLLDWGEAVNVTWGLPFVRTSVDHGVAYDAAAAHAEGAAEAIDVSGMHAAVRMAQQLTRPTPRVSTVGGAPA